MFLSFRVCMCVWTIETHNAAFLDMLLTFQKTKRVLHMIIIDTFFYIYYSLVLF